MGLFKTDQDTVDARKKINELLDDGRPLVMPDGRKLYGDAARQALPSLAGDSVLSVLGQIIASCFEDR